MHTLALSSSDSRRTAQTLLLAGLAGYWLIFVHAGWFNHGGTGVYLPYNLLAWCVVSGLCAGFWLLRPGSQPLDIGMSGVLLAVGATLMTLPLLWSPTAEAVSYALPRMVGLWAGMVFWLTLRQCRFSVPQKLLLLYCLAGSGIVEAGIVFTELYGPSGWLPVSWQWLLEKYGRYAVGVFQQANVTASFMATGLAISLFLLGYRDATLDGVRAERFRVGGLSAAVVLLTAALVLVRSRTGWLAGILVIGCVFTVLSTARFRHAGQHHRLLWLLPLTGVILGVGLMNVTVMQALNMHDGSNHQRLLTLYHTIQYVSHHPFLGYGAGTYEGYYQAYLAALPGGNPGAEVMEHPHNELLYQYAEGGIPALTGALLWCGLYFLLWRQVSSVLQAGTLVALLPILLHVQVEFPLYYSVPHWLALLTLLRLAEQETEARRVSRRWAFPAVSFQLAMFSLALYGAVLSFQGYQTGTLLARFEASELTPEEAEILPALPVPWVFRLRYEQDLTLLRLVSFQSTPDNTSLRAFTEENARWLSVLVSRERYSNQIAVLRYLKEPEQAAYWQKQATLMLPWEKSFRTY